MLLFDILIVKRKWVSSLYYSMFSHVSVFSVMKHLNVIACLSQQVMKNK